MKLSFAAPDDPWLYRVFWLISVGWFVVPAWLSPFSGIAIDYFNRPDIARWLSGWVQVDRWVVLPQLRLLEFVSPPLSERWPGPLADGLTQQHRILYSLFYGVLGWICVRLICHQQENWWLRVIWTGIYWVFCFGFVEGVAFLMGHFGTLPAG